MIARALPLLLLAIHFLSGPLIPLVAGGRYHCDVDVNGNVYILDAGQNVLRMYDSRKVLLAEVGGPGWASGEFDQPAGVWARNGLDIYVADYGNHRIQRFDRTLSFVSELMTRESENADLRFGYPEDVALSRLGELYICDSENIRILKINPVSQSSRPFGGIGGGGGRLRAPTAVEIGPKDNLYILDGSRIVVFDTFGNFLRTLYEPMFRTPSALFADETRVLVLQGDSVYCLDAAERILPILPLAAVKELNGAAVRGVASARGSLYLLTDETFVTIPDPWGGDDASEGSVDTEGKNR